MRQSHFMLTWLLMVCTTLAIRMSGDIFIPSIAHMASDLGISKAEATSNLTYYYLWLMFSYILFGRICDHVAKKKLLMCSALACLAGCILCAIAPNMIVLNIGRSLQALATGCVLLTTQVWIGSFSDKNNMLGRLAWFSLVTTLSPVLAPSIGGFVTDTLSWRYDFWLVAMLCVLLLPAIGMTEVREYGGTEVRGHGGTFMVNGSWLMVNVMSDHIKQTVQGYWEVLRHSPIEPFTLTVQGLFLAQGTFNAINSFLFVQEFGVSATTLGILIIPIVIGLVTGRFPTMYLRSHYGVKPTFIVNVVIVTASTAFLIAYYLITGTHDKIEVIVTLTLQAIGFSGLTILSLNNSMLVAGASKGTVSGFYNFMNQGASLAGILLAQVLFSIGLHGIRILQYSAYLLLTTTIVGTWLFLRVYPKYKNMLD